VAGADFAKGSRYARGGGSEDITRLRSAGNTVLNAVANVAFKTKFSDLCYGYNAFWRDLVPVLDLPALDLPGPVNGMLWGDGFEIETVINCRFAAAQVRIVEVPSTELSRLHGESNLRTFRDGTRVLRTIVAEHRRMRRSPEVSGVTCLERARGSRQPQFDLESAEGGVDSEQRVASSPL
jgi:hypothetical protein